MFVGLCFSRERCEGFFCRNLLHIYSNTFASLTFFIVSLVCMVYVCYKLHLQLACVDFYHNSISMYDISTFAACMCGLLDLLLGRG